MNEQQFYDYIQEHYTLDGTAGRLIDNIINFVKDGNYDDAETAHRELLHLFDGAFGITEEEIKLYRSDECEQQSLRERLEQNAQKSREMFPESSQPDSKQREKERDERE